METQTPPESRPSRDAELAGDIELTDEDLEGVTGGLMRVYLPGPDGHDAPKPFLPGFQPPGLQ